MQRIFLKYESAKVPSVFDKSAGPDTMTPEECLDWCISNPGCDFFTYTKLSNGCFSTVSILPLVADETVDFYRATCA